MIIYIFKRIIFVLPVLFGSSILVFILLNLAPGDPITKLVGPFASAETRESIKIAYGLNEPMIVQYFKWVYNLLNGNLGISIEKSVPVYDIVIDRLYNSIVLSLFSGIIGILFGLICGSICALYHNKLLDKIILLLFVLGISIPPYWLAIVSIFVFSIEFEWFPTGGMYNVDGEENLFDLIRHIILPGLLASLIPGAIIGRVTRTAILEQIYQDYVRTALGKGINKFFVFFNHILPNALPSIVNMTSLQIGYLMLGSAVFIEIVFNWPGLGLLAYQAILARDIPVLLGIIIVSSVLFVLLNIIADTVLLLIDPRTNFK
jgi:peptide/nickel transport system permease protein|tara:strand:- start:1046 stop:1999 length:954 start_codon:yes stop_codon:yes gene_type:complete